MNAPRWFPVHKYGLPRDLPCPSSVPWSFVEPHEQQAVLNHSQTLQRIADRGGLSPQELVALAEGRSWCSMPDTEAVARLKGLLYDHVRKSHAPQIARLRELAARMARAADEGSSRGGIALRTVDEWTDELRSALDEMGARL